MTPEQAAAHQERMQKSARKVQLLEPLKRNRDHDKEAQKREKPESRLEAAKRRSERRHKAKLAKLKERDVLKACGEILEAHPKVGLWWRQNTGAVKVDGRYLKFSFKGASDLMAITTGGIFMAVECKATGKRMTPEQTAFLGNVAGAGGLAYCVDDPKQLAQILECV